MSTALIRVEPSSMPRAVRPPAIASPASIVISRDPSPRRWEPARPPSRRRGAGAGAHQQRGGNRVLVQLLAAEPGEHELDAAAAELGEVLAHGGQRWGQVRRLGEVVEADDADVARRLQPLLVEGGEQAEGHLVVGEEDRGDVVAVADPAGQLLAGG